MAWTGRFWIHPKQIPRAQQITSGQITGRCHQLLIDRNGILLPQQSYGLTCRCWFRSDFCMACYGKAKPEIDEVWDDDDDDDEEEEEEEEDKDYKDEDDYDDDNTCIHHLCVTCEHVRLTATQDIQNRQLNHKKQTNYICWQQTCWDMLTIEPQATKPMAKLWVHPYLLPHWKGSVAWLLALQNRFDAQCKWVESWWNLLLKRGLLPNSHFLPFLTSIFMCFSFLNSQNHPSH